MADYRLDTLDGTRILMTGHSGFLGSWLAGIAARLGATVVGYSLSASPVEVERAAWLGFIGVDNIDGDVRDYGALLGAAGRAGCDLIINGTAVRPWQHVLDVAHGILLLAVTMLGGRIPVGEAYNFAPPHEGAGVRQLSEELARAWGGATISDEDRPGPFHEDRTLRLDSRKAAEELGWEHRFDLSATALDVVEWHRGVARRASPAEMTMIQIDRFLHVLGHRRSSTTSGRRNECSW